MDYLVKLLFISGRFLTQVAGKTILQVYYKSVDIHQNMLLKYYRTTQIINDGENMLDVLNLRVEEIGLHEGKLSACISDELYSELDKCKKLSADAEIFLNIDLSNYKTKKDNSKSKNAVKKPKTLHGEAKKRHSAEREVNIATKYSSIPSSDQFNNLNKSKSLKELPRKHISKQDMPPKKQLNKENILVKKDNDKHYTLIKNKPNKELTKIKGGVIDKTSKDDLLLNKKDNNDIKTLQVEKQIVKKESLNLKSNDSYRKTKRTKIRQRDCKTEPSVSNKNSLNMLVNETTNKNDFEICKLLIGDSGMYELPPKNKTNKKKAGKTAKDVGNVLNSNTESLFEVIQKKLQGELEKRGFKDVTISLDDVDGAKKLSCVKNDSSLNKEVKLKSQKADYLKMLNSDKKALAEITGTSIFDQNNESSDDLLEKFCSKKWKTYSTEKKQKNTSDNLGFLLGDESTTSMNKSKTKKIKSQSGKTQNKEKKSNVAQLSESLLDYNDFFKLANSKKTSRTQSLDTFGNFSTKKQSIDLLKKDLKISNYECANILYDWEIESQLILMEQDMDKSNKNFFQNTKQMLINEINNQNTTSKDILPTKTEMKLKSSIANLEEANKLVKKTKSTENTVVKSENISKPDGGRSKKKIKPLKNVGVPHEVFCLDYKPPKMTKPKQNDLKSVKQRIKDNIELFNFDKNKLLAVEDIDKNLEKFSNKPQASNDIKKHIKQNCKFDNNTNKETKQFNNSIDNNLNIHGKNIKEIDDYLFKKAKQKVNSKYNLNIDDLHQNNVEADNLSKKSSPTYNAISKTLERLKKVNESLKNEFEDGNKQYNQADYEAKMDNTIPLTDQAINDKLIIENDILTKENQVVFETIDAGSVKSNTDAGKVLLDQSRRRIHNKINNNTNDNKKAKKAKNKMCIGSEMCLFDIEPKYSLDNNEEACAMNALRYDMEFNPIGFEYCAQTNVNKKTVDDKLKSCNVQHVFTINNCKRDVKNLSNVIEEQKQLTDYYRSMQKSSFMNLDHVNIIFNKDEPNTQTKYDKEKVLKVNYNKSLQKMSVDNLDNVHKEEINISSKNDNKIFLEDNKNMKKTSVMNLDHVNIKFNTDNLDNVHKEEINILSKNDNEIFLEDNKNMKKTSVMNLDHVNIKFNTEESNMSSNSDTKTVLENNKKIASKLYREEYNFIYASHNLAKNDKDLQELDSFYKETKNNKSENKSENKPPYVKNKNMLKNEIKSESQSIENIEPVNKTNVTENNNLNQIQTNLDIKNDQQSFAEQHQYDFNNKQSNTEQHIIIETAPNEEQYFNTTNENNTKYMANTLENNKTLNLKETKSDRVEEDFTEENNQNTFENKIVTKQMVADKQESIDDDYLIRKVKEILARNDKANKTQQNVEEDYFIKKLRQKLLNANEQTENKQVEATSNINIQQNARENEKLPQNKEGMDSDDYFVKKYRDRILNLGKLDHNIENASLQQNIKDVLDKEIEDYVSRSTFHDLMDVSLKHEVVDKKKIEAKASKEFIYNEKAEKNQQEISRENENLYSNSCEFEDDIKCFVKHRKTSVDKANKKFEKMQIDGGTNDITYFEKLMVTNVDKKVVVTEKPKDFLKEFQKHTSEDIDSTKESKDNQEVLENKTRSVYKATKNLIEKYVFSDKHKNDHSHHSNKTKNSSDSQLEHVEKNSRLKLDIDNNNKINLHNTTKKVADFVKQGNKTPVNNTKQPSGRVENKTKEQKINVTDNVATTPNFKQTKTAQQKTNSEQIKAKNNLTKDANIKKENTSNPKLENKQEKDNKIEKAKKLNANRNLINKNSNDNLANKNAKDNLTTKNLKDDLVTQKSKENLTNKNFKDNLITKKSKENLTNNVTNNKEKDSKLGDNKTTPEQNNNELSTVNFLKLINSEIADSICERFECNLSNENKNAVIKNENEVKPVEDTYQNVHLSASEDLKIINSEIADSIGERYQCLYSQDHQCKKDNVQNVEITAKSDFKVSVEDEINLLTSEIADCVCDNINCTCTRQNFKVYDLKNLYNKFDYANGKLTSQQEISVLCSEVADCVCDCCHCSALQPCDCPIHSNDGSSSIGKQKESSKKVSDDSIVLLDRRVRVYDVEEQRNRLKEQGLPPEKIEEFIKRHNNPETNEDNNTKKLQDVKTGEDLTNKQPNSTMNCSKFDVECAQTVPQPEIIDLRGDDDHDCIEAENLHDNIKKTDETPPKYGSLVEQVAMALYKKKLDQNYLDQIKTSAKIILESQNKIKDVSKTTNCKENIKVNKPPIEETKLETKSPENNVHSLKNIEGNTNISPLDKNEYKNDYVSCEYALYDNKQEFHTQENTLENSIMCLEQVFSKTVSLVDDVTKTIYKTCQSVENANQDIKNNQELYTNNENKSDLYKNQQNVPNFMQCGFGSNLFELVGKTLQKNFEQYNEKCNVAYLHENAEISNNDPFEKTNSCKNMELNIKTKQFMEDINNTLLNINQSGVNDAKKILLEKAQIFIEEICKLDKNIKENDNIANIESDKCKNLPALQQKLPEEFSKKNVGNMGKCNEVMQRLEDNTETISSRKHFETTKPVFTSSHSSKPILASSYKVVNDEMLENIRKNKQILNENLQKFEDVNYNNEQNRKSENLFDKKQNKLLLDYNNKNKPILTRLDVNKHIVSVPKEEKDNFIQDKTCALLISSARSFIESLNDTLNKRASNLSIHGSEMSKSMMTTDIDLDMRMRYNDNNVGNPFLIPNKQILTFNNSFSDFGDDLNTSGSSDDFRKLLKRPPNFESGLNRPYSTSEQSNNVKTYLDRLKNDLVKLKGMLDHNKSQQNYLLYANCLSELSLVPNEILLQNDELLKQKVFHDLEETMYLVKKQLEQQNMTNEIIDSLNLSALDEHKNDGDDVVMQELDCNIKRVIEALENISTLNKIKEQLECNENVMHVNENVFKEFENLLNGSQNIYLNNPHKIYSFNNITNNQNNNQQTKTENENKTELNYFNERNPEILLNKQIDNNNITNCNVFDVKQERENLLKLNENAFATLENNINSFSKISCDAFDVKEDKEEREKLIKVNENAFTTLEKNINSIKILDDKNKIDKNINLNNKSNVNIPKPKHLHKIEIANYIQNRAVDYRSLKKQTNNLKKIDNMKKIFVSGKVNKKYMPKNTKTINLRYKSKADHHKKNKNSSATSENVYKDTKLTLKNNNGKLTIVERSKNKLKNIVDTTKSYLEVKLEENIKNEPFDKNAQENIVGNKKHVSVEVSQLDAICNMKQVPSTEVRQLDAVYNVKQKNKTKATLENDTYNVKQTSKTTSTRLDDVYNLNNENTATKIKCNVKQNNKSTTTLIDDAKNITNETTAKKITKVECNSKQDNTSTTSVIDDVENLKNKLTATNAKTKSTKAKCINLIDLLLCGKIDPEVSNKLKEEKHLLQNKKEVDVEKENNSLLNIKNNLEKIASTKSLNVDKYEPKSIDLTENIEPINLEANKSTKIEANVKPKQTKFEVKDRIEPTKVQKLEVGKLNENIKVEQMNVEWPKKLDQNQSENTRKTRKSYMELNNKSEQTKADVIKNTEQIKTEVKSNQTKIEFHQNAKQTKTEVNRKQEPIKFGKKPSKPSFQNISKLIKNAANVPPKKLLDSKMKEQVNVNKNQCSLDNNRITDTEPAPPIVKQTPVNKKPLKQSAGSCFDLNKNEKTAKKNKNIELNSPRSNIEIKNQKSRFDVITPSHKNTIVNQSKPDFNKKGNLNQSSLDVNKKASFNLKTGDALQDNNKISKDVKKQAVKTNEPTRRYNAQQNVKKATSEKKTNESKVSKIPTKTSYIPKMDTARSTVAIIKQKEFEREKVKLQKSVSKLLNNEPCVADSAKTKNVQLLTWDSMTIENIRNKANQDAHETKTNVSKTSLKFQNDRKKFTTNKAANEDLKAYKNAPRKIMYSTQNEVVENLTTNPVSILPNNLEESNDLLNNTKNKNVFYALLNENNEENRNKKIKLQKKLSSNFKELPKNDYHNTTKVNDVSKSENNSTACIDDFLEKISMGPIKSELFDKVIIQAKSNINLNNNKSSKNNFTATSAPDLLKSFSFKKATSLENKSKLNSGKNYENDILKKITNAKHPSQKQQSFNSYAKKYNTDRLAQSTPNLIKFLPTVHEEGVKVKSRIPIKTKNYEDLNKTVKKINNVLEDVKNYNNNNKEKSVIPLQNQINQNVNSKNEKAYFDTKLSRENFLNQMEQVVAEKSVKKQTENNLFVNVNVNHILNKTRSKYDGTNTTQNNDLTNQTNRKIHSSHKRKQYLTSLKSKSDFLTHMNIESSLMLNDKLNESLGLVKTSSNPLILSSLNVKPIETFKNDVYIRDPHLTNVHNLKPNLVLTKKSGLLPNATLWNTHNKLKFEVAQKKLKEEIKPKETKPKKYKYETKYVKSSVSNTPMKVVFLVEDE